MSCFRGLQKHHPAHIFANLQAAEFCISARFLFLWGSNSGKWNFPLVCRRCVSVQRFGALSAFFEPSIRHLLPGLSAPALVFSGKPGGR